jgi:hypothetical protein
MLERMLGVSVQSGFEAFISSLAKRFEQLLKDSEGKVVESERCNVSNQSRILNEILVFFLLFCYILIIVHSLFFRSRGFPRL